MRAHPGVWPPAEGAPPSAGLTWRSLLIAIVLTVICGFWVRQAEIVVLATQVTESVPPIPALAVLLALVALKPALGPLARRFSLTRAELLSIYCFVGIAISMSGPGIIRFWLTLVTAPFYFNTPENGFAGLQRWIPSWLAVKDKTLIHRLYEGGHGLGTPWRAWAVPLAVWSLFILAFWVCLLCLALLVRQRWMHEERLTFPIVKLPVEITAENEGQTPFLRSSVMWSGFGLAAIYNFSNMANALFPSIPSPGKMFDVTPLLTTAPWKSLAPLTLHYRPELIGFGFLVPTEVCFSIWFFYVAGQLEALVAALSGGNFPGVPFQQEQSMGAYLLLGFWFLWQIRTDLAAPLREAWRTKSLRSSADGPPLWAAVGLAVGFVFLCWFCTAAGMAAWVAALFLAVVLLTGLVSARVRAEAGIPLIWLFPFYQPSKLLLYTLGTSAFLVNGVPATLTIFAMLTFLSRGYLLALAGAQVESLKIAEEVKMPRSRMCILIILAAAVGLAVAYAIHLTTYYQYGAQNLGGIWGSWLAMPQYASVVSASSVHQGPDSFRTLATAAGAVVTLILVLLRRSFVGFPLHPLGFAVATAYGSLLWWSFLIVWIVKVLILKWGGMNLYRRAIPFFLGLALGHFFAAGMVWGILGAFWPDAARAYGVWFG